LLVWNYGVRIEGREGNNKYMGKKTLTAHFFSIEKMVGAELTMLSKNELELALDSISEFKVDRKKELSRYFFNGIDERCVMFRSDMEEIPRPKRETYVPGLFIKRRTSNYPYENNDTGKLFQIQLSNEDNELAEVTFFIIDTSLRVLLFVSNPYVGSISSFENYINNRLKEYHSSISPLPFFNDESFVKFEFPVIINETPENDFDSMVNISVFEMYVAGSLKFLESTLKSKKDDSQTALLKLVQLSEKTRSKTMRFMLSSSYGSEKLDKATIKQIYKRMKPFFNNSEKENKFIVKGKIDDEVRFLDLLNADYFHKTLFSYDGKYVPIDEVFQKLYPIMDRYRDIFIQKNGFKEDKG
jgi:hypothetical protein